LPVLHEQMFGRQGVAQGGLPRVRIAGEGHQMIAPVLPHDPADFPFPADRLELVSDLLHPSLHGFVVCVDALFPARHESGPLPDVALVDPFAKERDLVMEEGEFDLELSFPARGALREQLEEHAEADGELTLNKVDYTPREPAGTPSLREVEDGTRRDPPAVMPQSRMDQTETCSITPRSRGQVWVASNPSPTREITPRAADTYRRDGRRIRNARIAERPPPP